jgi:hypothetical protein
MPVGNSQQKQMVERKEGRANPSHGRVCRKIGNYVHLEKLCVDNMSY